MPMARRNSDTFSMTTKQILTCLVVLGSIVVPCVEAAPGSLRRFAQEVTNVTTTTANFTNVTNVTTMEPTFIVDSAFEAEIDDETVDSTTDPPVPANDECPNAQLLPVTSGSPNTHATVWHPGTTVGAISRDAGGCQGQFVTSPGVWYTVQGTGQTIVASTCSENTHMDTTIRVYRGNNCNERVCVTLNLDAPGPYHNCEAQPLASRAVWDSEVGVTYYILVHGLGPRFVGQFELSLTGYTLNDECPLAHEVPLNKPIPGDTTHAQVDAADALEQCGYDSSDYAGEWANLYGPRSPRGLWYSVEGTGQRLRATTCQSDGPPLYRAHRMHVFEGDCNSCLGGMVDTTDCPTYEWDTTAGTIYYVTVHRTYPSSEDDNEDDESNTAVPQEEDRMPAPFVLTITEVTNDVAISRGAQLFD